MSRSYKRVQHTEPKCSGDSRQTFPNFHELLVALFKMLAVLAKLLFLPTTSIRTVKCSVILQARGSR